MAFKWKKIAKISIIFLMFILLFFSIKYFSVTSELNDYKENTELEIQILESQLGEILYKYDSVSIDSLRNNASKNSTYNDYQISSLEADSIVAFKKIINNKFIKKSLSNSESSKILLNIKKKNLNRLSAENINTKGVKIYSDFYRLSVSEIQQLRVCFTLQKNNVVKAGNKKVYIQVLNPKNQIISKGNKIIENSSGSKLQFSAFSEVNYNKIDLDVCDYVDLEQNKTIKGKYIINIYNEFTKIGSSTFDYK